MLKCHLFVRYGIKEGAHMPNYSQVSG